MRICHDCLTVNRSHLSYCQKCSGELGLSEAPYLSIKISKKDPGGSQSSCGSGWT